MARARAAVSPPHVVLSARMVKLKHIENDDHSQWRFSSYLPTTHIITIRCQRNSFASYPEALMSMGIVLNLVRYALVTRIGRTVSRRASPCPRETTVLVRADSQLVVRHLRKVLCTTEPGFSRWFPLKLTRLSGLHAAARFASCGNILNFVKYSRMLFVVASLNWMRTSAIIASTL